MLDVNGLAMLDVGESQLSLPAIESRPILLQTERLPIADEAETGFSAPNCRSENVRVATGDPVL
jgi:hypothetical protein